MRRRRDRADSATDSTEAQETDSPAEEPEADPQNALDDDSGNDTAGDDETDSGEKPTGRFSWLKPRKKRIDYGEPFNVTIARLPDLENFPEDGHVHPEIVRSWMALQQFGEAMLLVSWVERTPAGYVLVSWTGDWNDEVRREFPNVPALCNLWSDEQYVDEDVERRLLEAAIKVCTKQGRDSLLATVEADNKKVRAELGELGFSETDMTTSEKYVYRGADGRKRRGTQQNVVLLKEL